MAKKTTRPKTGKTAKKIVKRTVKTAVRAAKRGKAAKVKPSKLRAKADQKALHGATPPWSKAAVEEAFRRFQAAMR